MCISCLHSTTQMSFAELISSFPHHRHKSLPTRPLHVSKVEFEYFCHLNYRWFMHLFSTNNVLCTLPTVNMMATNMLWDIVSCTIAASKIKGTAREIYCIFPCNGDFPCIPTGVYTGETPASIHHCWHTLLAHKFGHMMVCGLPSRKKTEGVG